MKYIRTKDGIYKYDETKMLKMKPIKNEYKSHIGEYEGVIVYGIADTIEDLIQIGDIVFYWQQSDDKEHCSLMVYDSDIKTMKFNAITKLLIPVGNDYKCVAKGYPTFSVIRDRRYLVEKGELELI